MDSYYFTQGECYILWDQYPFILCGYRETIPRSSIEVVQNVPPILLIVVRSRISQFIASIDIHQTARLYIP